MKKIILILVLFISFSGFSQALQDQAPWMTSENLQKKGKTTLTDISNAAETYFKTIDKFAKGSGLKPFERWKYHWSFYTKKDGTIAPASDLWNAWEEKNARNLSKSTTDASNWSPLGPNASSNTYSSTSLKSSGQGRINAIAVDPNNSNTYYVGAPAGGIWKSTDAGANWTPLTDYLPQIGVSGIAIHPSNSNIIYIATGDDDAGDSYSVGVMKSTDGGATWNTTGSMTGNPQSMNEIYIDPNNPDTILVATSSGVMKSTNGGTSWDRKLSGNIKDLKMKPGDATTWYATSSNTFYRSTDSGESFTSVSIGALTGSTRLTIDVTIANSNYVYMVSAGSGSAFNGVYKSTNSGASFTKTTQSSDIFGSTQAWYDLALTVSSNNADIVYVGVLDIWKSTNGGNNFTKMNEWSNPNQDSFTHADIHFLRFIDGKFFAGTDGGIYVSENEGALFTDLTEGLGISQFYKISVSPQNSNNIAGGIQDNGGMAFNENKWRNYHGGDGMEGNIDPTAENTHYGFIQYGGRLYKTTDGGKTKDGGLVAPAAETGTNDSGGRWVTPMAINSTGVVYAGYKKLYKLENNAWVLTGSFSFRSDLYNIEIDPNNDDVIYTTKSSTLYRSIDKGVTFTTISFPFGTINGIEVSNNDSNIAWVVTNNGVYKTTNILSATPTFTNLSNGIPSENKLTLKHHERSGNNTVYLGTSLGVYYINDDITDWEIFDNNLPNVAVNDLDINENDAKLFAGTYGRGVFVTDIPTMLPENDIQLLSINTPTNAINCNTNITPEITVKNQGTAVITSITTIYTIDGGVENSIIWNGTLNSEATTTISIPSFSSKLGTHLLNVETTVTSDTYSSNNSATVSFKTNNSNTTPTTVNSFEKNSDKLLTGTSSSEVWERGAPNNALLNAAASGSNAYVTNLTGNYADNTTSYLYTNCYNLSTIINPVLKFKMGFDIEQDWDYMQMEYSTDSGTSWTTLGNASDPNWYNSAALTNASNQSSLPGKQWTGEGEDVSPLGGTNATLHAYSYDLAALTNETTIIFRFIFVTDELTNEEGVLIDDFVIDGTLSLNDQTLQSSFAIYPNPSDGVFNLLWSTTDKATISVYNFMGKLIIQKKNITSNYSLNLENYSTGLYFIKMTVNGKQATKKILLK